MMCPARSGGSALSGVGFVNNTLLLPHPEQAGLRAAFRAPLKPFMTVSHKTLEPTCGAFIDWIASGDDPRKLPSIVLHALRG